MVQLENMRFLKRTPKKEISGKVAILRTDLNIQGIEDAYRLEAALPTIQFLLKRRVRVIVISHRGRPNGRDSNLSLNLVVPFLEKRLRKIPVFFRDIPEVLPEGSLFLIENLRFWAGEETGNEEFVKKLASLADFYVNDAFAASHRSDASITKLPKFLPAYGGLLLEKEIVTLSRVMKSPQKPLILIFGGLKIGEKISVIKHFLKKAKAVLLRSSSLNIRLLSLKSKKILKPVDWVGANGSVLDIGKETVEKYLDVIKKAKTIIWNGPVGKFEDSQYAAGSVAVANAVARSKAFSVIGGGETTQLVSRLGLLKKFSFVSTGGGAMLKFLAGHELPGLTALEENDKLKIKKQ